MIGNDLAVHVGFPYCPGYQLSILTSKVKDQDLFCHCSAKIAKKVQGTRDKVQAKAQEKNQGTRYKGQARAQGTRLKKRHNVQDPKKRHKIQGAMMKKDRRLMAMVLGYWFLVLDSWILILDLGSCLYLVPCALCLFLVSCALNLVPSRVHLYPQKTSI